MSHQKEKLINEIMSKLPDVCSVRDLVRAKIFSNRDYAWRAREHNMGPSFIKVSEKFIAYRKEDVREWLTKAFHVPQESDFTETEESKDV